MLQDAAHHGALKHRIYNLYNGALKHRNYRVYKFCVRNDHPFRGALARKGPAVYLLHHHYDQQ